jgi:hypothetical protein
MALTPADKKEVETLIRKEIKDFLSATTLKKFEDNIIDKIKSEIKKGTLRSDINEVIVNMMSEFYYLMWTKKNTWQSTLKNKK